MAATENPEGQAPEEEREESVIEAEEFDAPADDAAEQLEDAIEAAEEADVIEAVEEIVEEAAEEAETEAEAETEPEMVSEDVEQAEDEESIPEPVPGPEAEVEPEAEDGRGWYVVHCYSGYENKVRHNLEQRIESMGMKEKIFDVVIPTQEEIEVRDGKRRSIERHVFPGYVLVNMIMSEESWYVVRNTPGVTGFVGMGNDPIPLRPEEVSQILRRMEAEAPTIKVTYKPGETVRIIDGPFNDFHGTVDEIDMERSKVRVMVNFFGRSTPVELDFLQVEKI
jgi:transcription termination/antitermination protein NusG